MNCTSAFPTRSPTSDRRRLGRHATSPQDRRIGSPYRHRCVGRAMFRSEAARDVALSLDLDTTIASWRCLPGIVRGRLDGKGCMTIRPDFLAVHHDGSMTVIDAVGLHGFEPLDPCLRYVDVAASAPLDDIALRNLRGIMCYADLTVPLADRIRFMGLLGEVGPATLTEACSVAKAADPIGSILALAAQGFLGIDWKSAPIGPDTIVRLPIRVPNQADARSSQESSR